MRAKVRWDWIDATGDAAAALRHHIGCSDLVVVSRRLDGPSLLDMRRIAGELIVRSGKPILAVPQGCPRLALDRVLLVWDGSPGAVTAMQATTILTVADGRAGLPAEDAATYSSRHGIAARIEPWQSSQGCTAQTLLAAIAARARPRRHGRLRPFPSRGGAARRRDADDARRKPGAGPLRALTRARRAAPRAGWS